jgi:aminocarboxymuconate-semialdehyde decarboxylase
MTTGHRPDGGPVIDCHAHLMPRAWQSATAPPSLFDIEGLLAEQERGGVDTTVFGYNWIRAAGGRSPLETVKSYNQFAAELTIRYPGRLLGLACSVPFGDDAVLTETEGAIRDSGLKGIMVNSSVDGEYLDSPRAEPFFQLVERLDVPVFIHPPRLTVGNEKMEAFRLPEMVGRLFDTTLSLVRFILGGGLQRHPTLKLVCAHVGGALPMLPGRLDFGYELRHDATFGPWTPDVLSAPPSASINRLYVDTVSFHPPAVLCAVGTFGVEQVLFGSDHPPVHIPLARSVDVVHRLPLDSRDKSRILGGNAERLLGLSGPVISPSAAGSVAAASPNLRRVKQP